MRRAQWPRRGGRVGRSGGRRAGWLAAMACRRACTFLVALTAVESITCLGFPQRHLRTFGGLSSLGPSSPLGVSKRGDAGERRAGRSRMRCGEREGARACRLERRARVCEAGRGPPGGGTSSGARRRGVADAQGRTQSRLSRAVVSVARISPTISSDAARLTKKGWRADQGGRALCCHVQAHRKGRHCGPAAAVPRAPPHRRGLGGAWPTTCVRSV